MQNFEELFSKAVAEIEKVLSTKTVVGEPIRIDGHTLVPLVSVGFGFGAAVGSGSDPKKSAGQGGGAGGGGGMKPVALVVIGPEGVRVEPILGATASVIDKAIGAIGTVVKQTKAPEEPAAG